MKIIRGRLSSADVSNPSYRYDTDCDCVQYTPDGGSTWQDAPGNDPRHAPQFLKPPVGGSNKRCDAAANMVRWVHDFMDKIIAAMEEGATVLFVVNTLLDFVDLLFPGAVLLQLILDIAGGIFTLGAPLLSDAFAGDTYPLLLCIFDCNENSDGQVSVGQLATIESAVTTQLNTTAALVVNLILSVQGENGLSNAGSIGSETGDCADCVCCPDPVDWCQTILDIGVDNDGGFVPDNSDAIWGGFTHPVAVFTNNTGSPPPDNYAWVTSEVTRSGGEEIARIMIASRVFPAGTYTDVRFHWQVQFGTFTTDIRECTVKIDGNTMLDQAVDGEGDAHWTGSITGTPTIEIRYVCSYRVDSGSGGGGGEFTNLVVEGSGTKPTF